MLEIDWSLEVRKDPKLFNEAIDVLFRPHVGHYVLIDSNEVEGDLSKYIFFKHYVLGKLLAIENTYTFDEDEDREIEINGELEYTYGLVRVDGDVSNEQFQVFDSEMIDDLSCFIEALQGRMERAGTIDFTSQEILVFINDRDIHDIKMQLEVHLNVIQEIIDSFESLVNK